MLRKSGIGIMLALLVPSLASALGLGEYELKSYLNQPLNMEVELRQMRDFGADEVIVSIASESDYSRAGVERSFFHTNLEFTVEPSGDGTGTLRIRSRQPVREPYLNFLVEVLWPAGRLMREFTVLIDPPTHADRAEPVTEPEAPAPTVARPEPEPRPAEPARERPVERPAVTATPRERYTGPRDEYRVRSADTMWTIALNHRPDTSVSVQQMMRAIQNLNPDAFIDGNVNLVREGAVLRLPASQEVRDIATRQALADVAEQNRQWREMLQARGIAIPTRAPQIDGRATPTDRERARRDPREGRVTLVTPEAAEGAERARGTGVEGEGVDSSALQNELAIAEENLESLRRENRELASRLDDLEEQLGTGEQLLNLRNDQITRLQEELRRLQEERGVEVADSELLEPLPEADVTDPARVEDDEDLVGLVDDADPVVTEEPVTEPAEPAEPAEPSPVTPALPPVQVEQPGPMDVVMDNLVLLAAGLGALVLGVGGLLFLRQRRQAAEEEEFDADGETEFGDLSDDDFLSGFGDSEAESDSGAGDDEFPEADAEDASEGEDPLEKVEVFMAYGQHPQAVNHLRDAINRAPQRTDLKLRLLEVLAEMKDVDAFEAEAANLAGSGKDVDQRIDALRNELGGGAGEPSMDDLEMDLTSDLGAPGARQSAADDSDDFEFDLGDDDQPGGKPDDSEEDEILDDLGDFELDLADETEQKGAGASSDSSAEEEFSLDLDDGDEELSLDLDDEDGGLEFSLDDEKSDDADGQDQDQADAPLEFSLDDDEPEEQKKTSESSSLELDGPGESFESEEGDAALSLDDMSLDDMSDEFSGTSDSAGSDDEELDLSLDDLSLDDDSEQETRVDTPALDIESDDSGDGELSLDDLGVADDSEQTAVTEALSLDDDEPASPASEPAEAKPAGDESAEVAFSDDEDFDFLGDTDENATKLDLAKAYIDMGDNEGARDILNEVLSEGNNEQQAEAKELLGQVS